MIPLNTALVKGFFTLFIFLLKLPYTAAYKLLIAKKTARRIYLLLDTRMQFGVTYCYVFAFSTVNQKVTPSSVL